MRTGAWLLATLVCVTTGGTFVQTTVEPPSTCCLRWSNTQVERHLEKIVTYAVQPEGRCNIKAIVFQTVKKRTICSNPGSDQTIRAMQEIDRKNKALVEGPQEGQGPAPAARTEKAAAPEPRLFRRKGRRRRRRPGMNRLGKSV